MAKSDEIRAAVEQLGKRGRGRPYPRALKAAITTYAQERRDAGASLATIESEIAVPWRTFSRWVPPRPRRKAFRRVEMAAPRPQLIVHGPHGLRIDGLDFDGVAELLRRLG